MNYYIQGNAARAEEIKAAFEGKGIYSAFNFENENYLYYSCDGEVNFCFIGRGLSNIIKTHPDYQELELPIEPKFKVGDRIRWINHDVQEQTITDIKDDSYITVDKYGIKCALKFTKQDEWELVQPKPHYDIANFHAGMSVLVRPDNDCAWDYSIFSRITDNEYWKFSVCNGVSFTQCIPFEGNEHLLGTTDMPSEEFINW